MKGRPIPSQPRRIRRQQQRGGRSGGIISKKKNKKNDHQETEEDNPHDISSLISPKGSLAQVKPQITTLMSRDDDLMDIIEGQNIGTFHHMIEGGGNNGFLEIGEVIHEKTIPKTNILINIKKFQLNDYNDKKIEDVKNDLFQTKIDEGNNVRFLMDGRLLRDNEVLSEMKLDTKTQIQAFISPRFNFEPGEQAASARINNESKKPQQEGAKGDDNSDDEEAGDENNLDLQAIFRDSKGFDFFKLNGYSDEEIIWKRYTFHASYILSEYLDKINDDQLFVLEECFLMDNQRFLQNPELFKFCEFRSEKKEYVLFLDKVRRWLFFFLGLVFSFIAILASYRIDLRQDYKYSLMAGTFLNIVLVSVFFLQYSPSLFDFISHCQFITSIIYYFIYRPATTVFSSNQQYPLPYKQ